jgi:hypothetical protein
MSTISTDKINEQYKNGTAEERALLKKMFPEEFDGYNGIKSLQDALDYHKLTLDDVAISVPKALEKERARIQTSVYLDLICDAIRGDDPVLDFSNKDQRKYFCYFKYDAAASGFGFADTYYSYSGTYSSVGARRSFCTEEKARYFGETFIELINKELIG